MDDCWWLVAWWEDVEADGEAGRVADGAGLWVDDESHDLWNRGSGDDKSPAEGIWMSERGIIWVGRPLSSLEETTMGVLE